MSGCCCCRGGVCGGIYGIVVGRGLDGLTTEDTESSDDGGVSTWFNGGKNVCFGRVVVGGGVGCETFG